jgi:LemA protein
MQGPDMSATQWAVLATAAIIVFWMVGAYNRLMALRNGIGAAWQQIDAALKHRAAVLPPLLATLRAPLAAEQGALDALHAAQAQALQAAASLGARPVAVDTTAAWVQAEAALASRASRVLALLDQEPAWRDSPAVAALLQSWREATVELGFARRLFDTAAQTYNAAALQLPTRWLVRVYRLGLAGRLES